MVEYHDVMVNYVRLHYAEAAGPGPALVILHGLTGSHDEFMHLVPELAGQAHVYALDLRGHGRSAWTTNGYQVADYGRDIIPFRQQVVGRPAILLGHSLGGLATTWLAANAPGETFITLDGMLEPPQRDYYLFRAFAGQRAIIEIVSESNRANFALSGMNDGQPYKRVEDELHDWSAELPVTQDYLLTVAAPAGAQTTGYHIFLTIEPLESP